MEGKQREEKRIKEFENLWKTCEIWDKNYISQEKIKKSNRLTGVEELKCLFQRIFSDLTIRGMQFGDQSYVTLLFKDLFIN